MVKKTNLVVNSKGWTGRKPWPKRKKRESLWQYFYKNSGLEGLVFGLSFSLCGIWR